MALGFLLGVHASGADAPVKVTITQKTALEMVSPSGEVTGVKEAAVGDAFTFVSSQDGQVTLRDAQGGLVRIAQTATDYTPAPVAVPPTITPPAVASVAVTNAPPPPPASEVKSPAPASDPVAAINHGLGIQLFNGGDFWKESAQVIAARLGLGLEDKTKWETAYRRYFYNDKGGYAPASILGGNGYCIALYADANDVPTSALIAFTNDGDYEGVVRLTDEIFHLEHRHADSGKNEDKLKDALDGLQAKVATMEQTFESDRQAEQKTLTKNLTALFGDPQQTSFGSDATTREDATRWDWKGVSFLLTCQPDKYNLLRIVPTALADNHGRTERIARDEMRTKLSDAVEHRPNGDVVITQLPMADQGQKGYCVPATWERVLRYTGVPGDMYTLSRIGGAGFGGGEWGVEVAKQLDDTLHNYGRRAEIVEISKIDPIALHRYIDNGIPVFWSLNPRGYMSVMQRYHNGDRDKDWEGWKKLVDDSHATFKTLPPLVMDEGHQVLIIGYNPDTKEVAWSDPWGRETRERWMTEEEAERCSLGEFYIITW